MIWLIVGKECEKGDTMVEVTDSQLTHYIVHGVEETLVFGDEVFPQPEVLLEAAFTQLAFSKIKTEQQYEFFHESNIELNELYMYAKNIFNDESYFLEGSQHIATHLHSVSNHPNINKGDLFIGLFDNCLVGTEKRQVLSIVKIDEKELFLDVKNVQDTMQVTGVDGINVRKINNAAIIVDMGADEAPIVFMRTRKKDDVVYWQERFLKVKVQDEAYEKTNLALQEMRKHILKEENYTNTEKLGLLNKTLDYFRNEEAFQVDDYIETVFEKPEEETRENIVNTVKPYETIISEMAIEKAEKNYKRKIKLDENIEIIVNVRDIEEVEQLIKVGQDEDTGRKFYKIYFDEEI